MNKEKLIIVVLSLFIILIPSLLLSIACLLIWNVFWPCFLSNLAICWLIGQISNMFFQQKANVEIHKLQNKLIEINNQQSIETTCSYCKNRNIVPIKLNQRNTFNCSNCKQNNLVIFQFATAQITTPLEEPQLGVLSK